MIVGGCPSLGREEGPHPQPPEKAPNYNSHNALGHPAPLPRGPWLLSIMGVVVRTGRRVGAWGPQTRSLKPGRQPSPVPTDGFALGRAPLAPPYAVVLISCSGLLAFIFLLLTCLCCKRGDVGFKVRCTRRFRVGRKTPARPLPQVVGEGVGQFV